MSNPYNESSSQPNNPYGTPAPPPVNHYNHGGSNGYSHNNNSVSFDTQKIMVILSYVGGIFLSWLVPVVLYIVFPKATAPAWLHNHLKESLNFQITLFIGYVIGWVTSIILVGYLLLGALWVSGIVVAILATIAASRGEEYRVPFNIRIIK